MKKFLALALVAMMSSLVAPPASAADLKDGIYESRFGAGDCGVLTVSSGGKNLKYKSGRCGQPPRFRSSASFNGTVIRIMDARLVVSKITSTSISGRWKLGTYEANHTFRKIG